MGGEATSPARMLVKMELSEGGEQVICLLRSSLLPRALGCSVACLSRSQLELLSQGWLLHRHPPAVPIAGHVPQQWQTYLTKLQGHK